MIRPNKPIKSRQCALPECGVIYTPTNFGQKFHSPKCAYKHKLAKGVPKKKKEFKQRTPIKKKPYVFKRKPIRKKPISAEDLVFMQNKNELKEAQIMSNGCTFCEVCFMNLQVDAHHIVFRSEKPHHPEIHSKVNLILVCRKHHVWFHKSKGNRNKIVEDRKLNEIFGQDVLDK